MTSATPHGDPSDRVTRAYREAQTVSSTEVRASDAELSELAGNWKDEAIPDLQRSVADVQLSNLARGVVDPVFASLAEALRRVEEPRFSILDAACASGYYSEVIRTLDDRPIAYTGCDYSAAMIDSARAHYPDLPFSVQDLTALTLADLSFDVVLLAGVLEHIPEYRRAIGESTRVAGRYVIVHRCPTTTGRVHERTIGTQYNITTPRTFFSLPLLRSEFSAAGFELIGTVEVYPKRVSWRRRAGELATGWRRHDSRGTFTLVFRRR